MVLDGVQDDDFGPSTAFSEKCTMAAFQKGYLSISNLSPKTTDTSVFHDLNHSLISRGKL